MIALFAVGVVTGTILTFEMGLLWPEFHGPLRRRIRPRLRARGLLVLRRGDLHRIYVYGWDRLSPRAHFLSRDPDRVAGITGSLTVISVNAWMNHPRRLPAARRPGRRRPPAGVRCSATPTCGRARAHVPRRLHRRRLPARRRLRLALAPRRPQPLRAHRARRSRSRSPRSPRRFRSSSATGSPARWPTTSRLKLAAFEGLSETTRGAPVTSAAGSRRRSQGGIEIPRLLSLLAAHDPDAAVEGLDAVPPQDRPPVNVVRVAFQIMVGDRDLPRAARRSSMSSILVPAAAAAASPWFFRAVVARRPALGHRADRRLGGHGGRAPAVGRLRRDAHRGGGHRGRTDPGRYATLVVVYMALIAAVGGFCAGSRGRRSSRREPARETPQHAG